jgi:hypothetical protein
LTNRPRSRRLTAAVTIALLLGALVTALLGPAQTLAQTRKACSSSAAHANKAKHTAHPCTTHKGKGKGHSTGAGKPKHAAKKTHRSSSGRAIQASCESGTAPVLNGGSFSCEDGSEPQCVDGSTPKASRNGKLLLCPVATEGESASGEAECEEEELECMTSGDSGELACEAPSSASLACEAEGEV